jgi:hypothetical protein
MSSNITIRKLIPISLVYYQHEQAMFIPRFFDIEFTLYSVPEDDTESGIMDASMHQLISYHKCMYFLENILDGSLVVDADGMALAKKLVEDDTDNNIVVIPSLTEQTILGAIQAKLYALCSGGTVIDRVTLSDVREKTTFDLFAEDGVIEGLLPESGRWLGNFPYWETPWWNRPDAVTFDNYAESMDEYEFWTSEENQELVAKDTTAEFLDIENAIRERHASLKTRAEIIDIGKL